MNNGKRIQRHADLCPLVGRRGEASEVSDLQTQLESLLDRVWRCEEAWRREDRVDRAIRYGAKR